MKAAILLALIGSAFAQKGALPQPKKLTSQPEYSCPGGFNLVGKECVQMVSAPPTAFCATGTLDANNQCLVSSPRMTRCPMGTQQSSQGCTSTTQTPATRACPAGYQDNGFACETTEYLQVIQTCETGTKEGTQCVTIEAVAYQTEQFCPPGYEQSGKGGCWRTEVYDCTPPQSGKGGFGFRGLAGKQGGRSFPTFGAATGFGQGSFGTGPGVSTKHGHSRPGAPATPLAIAPIPIAATGGAPVQFAAATASVATASSQVVQQTCERKEAAPPTVNKSCPAGYTDSGKECFTKNFFSPTSRCINGAPAEACFKTLNAPHKMECTPGTVLQNGVCVSANVSPMEQYCSNGFADNGNSCTATQPAQLRCDGGLVLSGDVCIGKQTAQPQVTVSVTCTGKDCYH